MWRPGAKEPDWLGELADLVLTRREEEPRKLASTLCGKIAFLEVTQLAISATGIRNMIDQGKSPRYLLPDAVLEMIQSQALYGSRSLTAI